MELPTASIRYGGTSNKLQTCPRCDQSADKHPLAGIEPSKETNKAVFDFASLLAGQVVDLKKYGQVERTEFMLGAMIARAGGKVYRWVAHSGANIVRSDTMGGGWAVIKDFPQELGDTKCYGVDGFVFTPVMTGKRTQCAAPKLLCNLFKELAGASIVSIEMTELWWRNPVTKPDEPNRAWNQWEPVPSCDSCKQFVPQMLCYAPEMGFEGFKPVELLPKGTQNRTIRCANGHTVEVAIPDSAWSSYAAHTEGVSTFCPKCRKDVLCVDPARLKVNDVSCAHCGELFKPSIAVADNNVRLECPTCGGAGLYRFRDKPFTKPTVRELISKKL